MTVSTTTRRAGPFAGNGVTTSFPFTFKVFARSDLAVYLVDASDNETLLTLDSHYSVTLNADQDASPGGSITYPVSGSAMASGYRLYALSGIPATQATDFTNLGRFFPETHEEAFDKLTALVQQLKERSDRSLAVSPLDADAPGALPVATSRAGKYFAFDANGDPVMSSGTGADAGLRTDLAADTGSSLVNFKLTATGAAARSVLDKLDDLPLLTDFAGVDNTGTTDSTAGLAAVITWSKSFAATATERGILVPAGEYKCTTWATAGASRTTFYALGSVLITGTSTAGTGAILDCDGGTTTQSNKLNFIGNFTVQAGVGASYQYGVKISYLNNSRWHMTAAGGFTLSTIDINYSWDNPELFLYATNSSGLAIPTIKCGTNNFNNNRMYVRTTGSSNMAVASVGMELTGSGNYVQGDFSSCQTGLKLVACRGCVVGPIYTEITKYPIAASGNPKGTKIQGGEVEVGTNGSIDLGSSENTSISGLRIKGIGGGSNRTAIDMGAACYGLHTDGLSIDSATIDNAYAGTWRGDGGFTKSFNVGAYQWIAFPATQVSSSNANTLDDYEEVNSSGWTPILIAQTPGDLAVAYSDRRGSYTKNGREVTLTASITTSAFTHTTAGGELRITGLPFASDASAGRAVGTFSFSGLTKAGYTQFNAYIEAGTSILVAKASGTATGRANVGIADFPTGGTVVIDITIPYFAAT